MKNIRPFFILLLFCIPLFFLNIQDTFTFGDDWAQYVKEAQNLASGKPYYESNYIYNPLNTSYAPPQYPPGYPLLLAPVVYIFGLAAKPILYLTAVFVALLLFSAYFYYRQRSKETTALCLSVILVYTSFIIDFKKHALSDIPCTLFITLYFALRGSQSLSFKRILLLAVIGAFSMLIRTQAVLLIVAEGIVFIYELIKNRQQEEKFPGKKIFRNPSFLLAGSMTVLFFVLNNLLFASPKSSLNFYKQIFTANTGFRHIIAQNTSYLLSLFTDTFHHSNHHPSVQTMIDLLVLSCICMSLLGLVTTLRKGLKTDIVFFLLMCGLILVTPVYQGLRYFLPAVPVLLLLTKEGLRVVLPQFFPIAPKKLALICTVIFLALGLDDYKKAALNTKEWTLEAQDTSAFNYVRSSIADSEIILFAKPRLLTLYTNKKSIVMSWLTSMESNKALFDSMHVTYLLLRKNLGGPVYTDYLQQPGITTDSVKINDLYTLYRLR